MKKLLVSCVLLLSVLCLTSVGFALEEGELCTFKGMGAFPAEDYFYGEVLQFTDRSVVGTWVHRLPTGELIIGEPDFMFCRPNGSSLVDFSGPATFDGRPDHSFILSVQDRAFGNGGGGVDLVTIESLTASRTPSPTTWEDGVLAVNETALVRIPDTLEIVTDDVHKGWAHLTFVRPTSHDRVTCRYRAKGGIFEFKKCTGEAPGTLPVEPNCVIAVEDMTLHLQQVTPNVPATIQVDLEVQTPPAGTDTYQITLFDPNGAEVYSTVDDLASGFLHGEF